MMDYLGMLPVAIWLGWPWLIVAWISGAALGYSIAAWRHGP